MRRLLRSIAKGEEITQDVSTLENPAILEQLEREQLELSARSVGASAPASLTREAAMIRPSIKGQRLVALFLLGCLLFNYPAAAPRSRGPARSSACPLLYAYIFAVWALLIGLMALVRANEAQAT